MYLIEQRSSSAVLVFSSGFSHSSTSPQSRNKHQQNHPHTSACPTGPMGGPGRCCVPRTGRRGAARARQTQQTQREAGCMCSRTTATCWPSLRPACSSGLRASTSCAWHATRAAIRACKQRAATRQRSGVGARASWRCWCVRRGLDAKQQYSRVQELKVKGHAFVLCIHTLATTCTPSTPSYTPPDLKGLPAHLQCLRGQGAPAAWPASCTRPVQGRHLPAPHHEARARGNVHHGGQQGAADWVC